MAPQQTPSSTLSFAEIKELITFARSEKVMIFEAHGLRVQFSPMAHDPPLGHESPQIDKTKNENESPYGHHKPV